MKQRIRAATVGAAKPLIIRTAGEERYLKLRRSTQRLIGRARTRRKRVEQRISEKRGFALTGRVIRQENLLSRVTQHCTPEKAAEENFDLVVDALDRHNVEWWLVQDYEGRGYRIGVADDARHRIAVILAKMRTAPAYVKAPGSGALALSNIDRLTSRDATGSVSICLPQVVEGTNWHLGFRYACTVEFWKSITTGGRKIIEAPSENRAAKLMSEADFALEETTTRRGRSCSTPSVLKRTMLEDVTFPIDAVYTWVDGADPEWLESKRRLEAEIAGLEFHPEANHTARFESKDELKYSLRSLEYFAPWFRKIYIVTSGQVPTWLNTDHPKVELVSHEDIYPEGDYLPTFNSNSIISRLHHIPGLSEHFIYLNDDVMFGKPVRPQDFFLPTGLAKVFPSRNHRPFGTPTAEDGPHFNLTRNIRRLLADDTGITVTRAIKHTPYALLKSVLFEMEERFSDAFEWTWSSRFRHHQDIVADQLYHYYAQMIGRAVPSSITYRYMNIRDENYRWIMRDTLRLRNRSTLCLNDAPVEGVEPITHEEVAHFLDSYYPCKSSFEA